MYYITKYYIYILPEQYYNWNQNVLHDVIYIAQYYIHLAKPVLQFVNVISVFHY